MVGRSLTKTLLLMDRHCVLCKMKQAEKKYLFFLLCVKIEHWFLKSYRFYRVETRAIIIIYFNYF